MFILIEYLYVYFSSNQKFWKCRRKQYGQYWLFKKKTWFYFDIDCLDSRRIQIALWHRLEFCFCISVSCNSGKHLQAFRFQLRVTKRMMVRWLNGHHLNGHESEQTTGDSEGWGGKPGMLQHMGLQKVRHALVTEQQQLQSERSH